MFIQHRLGVWSKVVAPAFAELLQQHAALRQISALR